ncbi:MAG TPA: alpha/beta hydrolase-fold protein [bacterium]|nr:alpha/beta hydrolase-fold protein [bacterium]HPN43520.1 alpha/beta hydrolase-fold protein [bacterium]
MKKFKLLFLLVIILSGHEYYTFAADNIPDLSQIKTEPVNVGYSFRIHSNILNEDRLIYVSLPDDYATSKKNYPVYYAVDGQWAFVHSTQAIGSLSGNDIIPKMIVVAIYTNDHRDWDLLPVRDEQTHTGGGGDKLLNFIKQELIPFIDKNYRTFPYRLLSGSSYGGVFVMHAFVTEPKLFNGFLTLSPSMWWNYRIMLKRTEDFLVKNPGLQNTLYLSVANEGLSMGVNALASLLEKKAPAGLAWKFEEYPQEVHGTITYKSTFNGLKFVFEDWLSEPINFETSGDLVTSKDTVKVKINSFSNQVRYTLDGSQPTMNSPLYEKPFVFTKPVIVRAMPFYGTGLPGRVDSLVIKNIPILTAETGLPVLKSGLKYDYFEGDWDLLPDFKTLTPVKSGFTGSFDMQERKRDDLYAIRYTGYIDIPADNVYTFFLVSDDGSRLQIGDKVVVNNDGLHGEVEVNGKIYLKQGKHRVAILFFQKSGGFALNAGWQSAAITRQPIPFTAFYYMD